MPIIERPDLMQRRRSIPSSLKLILLAAVILGFYIRSCWYDTKDKYYEIGNIELTSQTISSVDVTFEITNNTKLYKKESVIIRLFTDNGDELASRITDVEIKPRSQRRYRKLIDKWKRQLRQGEQLSHATVEIYKPTIF